MHKILYGLIIFLIAGILFFLRGNINQQISLISFWVRSFADRAYSYKNFENLIQENTILKFKLETLNNSSKDAKKKNNFKKFQTDIFSNYPFNDHSIIILNAGSNDGLSVGMPVVSDNDVILGKIVGIKKVQSTTQTIFDPDWKSTVIIGSNKIKALMKGGITPQLDFIPLDAKISAGDAVLNVSPEFPYGYLLGFVENIEQSKDGSWIIGSLKSGINLEFTDKVTVLTDFRQ